MTGPSVVLRRVGAGGMTRVLVVAVPLLVALLIARPLVGSPIGTLVIIAGIAVVGALLLHVEWAALLFVAAEPFEDYVRSVSGSAVKGLGAILVLAWLVRLTMPGLARRPRVTAQPGPVLRRGLSHPVAISGFVLVGVLFASTVAHSNGSLGAEVLTRYLSFLGALVVLIDCLYDRLSVRRVAVVFVASCTASASVGLANYLGGAARAGGPLADPNDFAFFMVAALPLALVLRRASRRPWLWDIASVLLAVAMVATLSRGAMFAVLAMVLYAVLNGVVRARVIGAVLATLVVLLAALSVSDPGLIQNSLTQKQAVAAQNVDDRLTRWRVTAEMTVDYPVLGAGPGGFKSDYTRYVDLSQTDPLHPLDVAHETYLEVSAELGLLGLGAFLALLSYGFGGAYRRSRIPDDVGRLAGGVCASLLGSAVAAVFLTEQYYLPLWMLAAFGAALDPRHHPVTAPQIQVQHNANVVTMVKGRGAR